MLLLPGSLEHMGDWDGLGRTTRGLRVGGDAWRRVGGSLALRPPPLRRPPSLPAAEVVGTT